MHYAICNKEQAETLVRMKLLVTGGGTGGHVYPGLSVLEAFEPRPELLWVGKQGGMEEGLLQRAGVPYKSIAAGGLVGMGWGTRLRNSLKLVSGFGEAWRILGAFKPDVVLSTGGYVTFPVGLAAWVRRIPIVIYLPDIKPGLAVRALAPPATKVAITTPETRAWFGKKSVVVGYPVRKTLAQPKLKAAARQTFNLPDDQKVILVTGASQGAHTLNETIGQNLEAFLREGYVIHLYGKSDGDWLQEQRAALSNGLKEKYLLFDYLHDTMSDALLASDLAVWRAGASSLGELPAAGLPAVLVPLPHGGVQQADNARWLQERGGAVTVEDERAAKELLPTVQSILREPEKLEGMRDAMRQMAHPGAAKNIADLLKAVANEA
jgi:UDP-N-acetylglucosamine--N-acetylmuramyl-(pentapeptide) pyrophosphoryl-undecaprenol N-acetylglucosamine transferase